MWFTILNLGSSIEGDMVTVGVIMSKHRSKAAAKGTCPRRLQLAVALDDAEEFEIGELVKLQDAGQSMTQRVVKLPKHIGVFVQDSSV